MDHTPGAGTEDSDPAALLQRTLASLRAAGIPEELVQQYRANVEGVTTLHAALQRAVEREDVAAAEVIAQQMQLEQEKLQALLPKMDASRTR
jgi:hypothetical protein